MIKPFFLVFLIFLFSHSLSFAQSKMEYFDGDWMPLRNKNGAVFYRMIEKRDDKFVVKDFFMKNDKLQMEAECSKVQPEIVMDGTATWYYENGTVQKAGTIENGEYVGQWKSYYEDGTPREEMKYKDGKELYLQYWLSTGDPVLQNGSGILVEKDNKDYLQFTTFRDSVRTSAYRINNVSKDTVYLEVDQTAEYIGGFPALYDHIGKQLVGKYPKEARRLGVQGRVFIEFIIDKNGQISNSFVLKGIGAGCDQVALDAFNTLSAWKPGIENGKPVKQMMVLPVVFRLN